MAVSSTPNTDALASPTYNPSIDPTTLSLYNIMGNSTNSDDLVAQYRQVIMGLPTINPFVGVLSNPQSCNISQAQTGLNEASAALTQQYNTVVTAGTPIPNPGGGGYSYTPTSQQIAAAATYQANVPQATASMDQAASTMSDFQDHTDRITSNLPAILGMVQSALGLAAAVGNLLNPCLGLSSFLGSIQAAGTAIMNKINAGIQQVKAAISAAMAVITSAIATINAAMAAITSAIAYVQKLAQSLAALVEAEITSLINSLINSARLGLAQLLASLPKDPCLSALVGTVGTGAVASVLAKI